MGERGHCSEPCMIDPAFKERDVVAGLLMTLLLAGLGFAAARLPGLSMIGPLAADTSVLAMIVKTVFSPPEPYAAGFSCAAKSLLRFGIVLLGVRLNFDLIIGAGWKILVLDVAVIAFSLFFFRWLSRLLGLSDLDVMVGRNRQPGSAAPPPSWPPLRWCAPATTSRRSRWSS